MSWSDGLRARFLHLGNAGKALDLPDPNAARPARRSTEYAATARAGCRGIALVDQTWACPTPSMSFSSL